MRYCAVWMVLTALGWSTASAQGLRLSVRLNDSTFFEGEPIYILAELRNETADTIWTSAPGFVFGTLRGALEGMNGAVPEHPIIADYLPASGERGVPLAPGKSMFETHVLLSRWGYPGPLTEHLFLRSLPPGEYTLSTRFVPNAWVTDAQLQALSPPVRFSVRERDDDENRQLQMVANLGAEAWDSQRRAGFVQDMIAHVRLRLAADSGDPFAAFLLKAGTEIVQGLGLGLSEAHKHDLVNLQLAVVRQYRTSSVGAFLMDAEPLRSERSAVAEALSFDRDGVLRSIIEARARRSSR